MLLFDFKTRPFPLFCRRTRSFIRQSFTNTATRPRPRPRPTTMASVQPSPQRSDNNTPNQDPSKPPVVCVFCGASPGTSPAHMSAARSLAHALHNAGMHLVYGGGTVGIMGEVARTLVALSGPRAVHGIIPQALMQFERKFDANGQEQEDGEGGQREIDENVFGRTTVVKDMHTRKMMMAREVMESGAGGGFVALSGGYGTLEELMEVTTWNQLGIHARGVVVYNVEGYWDGLLRWVRDAVEAGFVGEKNKGIMVEARSSEEVVEALKGYEVSEGRFRLHWGQT